MCALAGAAQHTLSAGHVALQLLIHPSHFGGAGSPGATHRVTRCACRSRQLLLDRIKPTGLSQSYWTCSLLQPPHVARLIHLPIVLPFAVLHAFQLLPDALAGHFSARLTCFLPSMPAPLPPSPCPLTDYESAQLVKKAMWPPHKPTAGRRSAATAAAAGTGRGGARQRSSSSRGRGRGISVRAARGSSKRSGSHASDLSDGSGSDVDAAKPEKGRAFFSFKGRKTRAAAAATAGSGDGDGSSSSGSEEEAEGDAAGSQEVEEAAAAWALWEAAGGNMASQDKDSDFDAAGEQPFHVGGCD